MVVPAEDESEPCDEAETVELLRQVAEHAERGEVEGSATARFTNS